MTKYEVKRLLLAQLKEILKRKKHKELIRQNYNRFLKRLYENKMKNKLK